MPTERTLVIIKPDALRKHFLEPILFRIWKEGFEIVAIRQMELTLHTAEEFYREHKGKLFYEPLTRFMSSGPCVVLIITRKDAIMHWRSVIGATNPADADIGTIRRLYGGPITRENAVHGSDSVASAAKEIELFFPEFAWSN